MYVCVKETDITISLEMETNFRKHHAQTFISDIGNPNPKPSVMGIESRMDA